MEMVTTFCGQEHLPLKWGIFSQNPLKCVRSKTLEISLMETSRGFESHPLRQQKCCVLASCEAKTQFFNFRIPTKSSGATAMQSKARPHLPVSRRHALARLQHTDALHPELRLRHVRHRRAGHGQLPDGPPLLLRISQIPPRSLTAVSPQGGSFSPATSTCAPVRAMVQCAPL